MCEEKLEAFQNIFLGAFAFQKFYGIHSGAWSTQGYSPSKNNIAYACVGVCRYINFFLKAMNPNSGKYIPVQYGGTEMRGPPLQMIQA